MKGGGGHEGESRQAGRSPFSGHTRRGKRHLPTMLDLPVEPTLRPFRKVAFPDFLWLLSVLRDQPLMQGAWPLTAILDAAQAATRRACERGAIVAEREPVFHGLLTDWERIPEPERDELVAEFRRSGVYDTVMPDGLAHALAAYDDAPGRWLVEPRITAGLVPERERAEEHLWETMRLGGSSYTELATDAIVLWLRGLVINDRIRWSRDEQGLMELVPLYPEGLDEDQRRGVAGAIRAMYQSLVGATGESEESLAWCKRFWQANRGLFPCVIPVTDEDDAFDRDAASARSAALYRQHYRFLDATDHIDPDLWDHDRYDVLTGVTWRILRIAAHLASHRAYWSEEHGYPAARMLFEGYVQLRWMIAVEGTRPGVWHEFKNYGRGRTKALLLHTEAVLARTEGEHRATLERLLPMLKERANRDIREDFQDIVIADSFAADTSLFAMAKAVGMEDEYHTVMIPASSGLHGDWSAIDDEIVVRCRHALHDSHSVPRAAYASESMEQFPILAETYARLAFRAYCEAMDYEPMSDEEAEAEMRAASEASGTDGS